MKRLACCLSACMLTTLAAAVWPCPAMAERASTIEPLLHARAAGPATGALSPGISSPTGHRQVLEPVSPTEVWLGPEGSLSAESQADAGLAPAAIAKSLAPAGIAFDGMDFRDSGGSVPPSPSLAVGPGHIMMGVNVAFAIHSKNGATLLGPVPAGSLFSQAPCTSGVYHPTVLYDAKAGRWLIGFNQGALNSAGGYCLLVSQGNDPLGAYHEYFFPLHGANGWLESAQASVGVTHIFVGGNFFTLGGGFVEGRIYGLNKASLYAGQPVTAVMQGLGGNLDTPVPIRLHGASTGTWPDWGDTHFFIAQPYDGVNYTLLEWDTATLANRGSLAIGTGLFPVQATQSGGSNIQGGDWRPRDFEYRNGFGWMSATNACSPQGSTVNCILWAQIDLSTSVATLGPAGSGLFGTDGEHRIFPDLAVNHCNGMAIGYTKTGSNLFPSIWVAAREAALPVGQFGGELALKTGEIAYTAFDSAPRRWGEQTSMTIDPNGMTFWYLGIYSKITGNPSGRWGTFVGSFVDLTCIIPLIMRDGFESE
jgi:hypothetical protein